MARHQSSFEGDGVGGDVHLGLVVGDVDDSPSARKASRSWVRTVRTGRRSPRRHRTLHLGQQNSMRADASARTSRTMPSGPNLFDDEEGRDSRTSVGPGQIRPVADRLHRGRSSNRRGAQLPVRRAVVVGGVVAVLATASIVIGQLMGSERGRHRLGAQSAPTGTARAGRRSHRTRHRRRPEGEEIVGSIRRSVAERSAIVDAALVVANDEAVAVVDVGDRERRRVRPRRPGHRQPAGSRARADRPRPDGAGPCWSTARAVR